ncbi:hypothetical protein P7K49_022718 [Saguinus oedipus]|uniref:Uncharacterized protein n=1 Tax=Saguinus oedipus TaxID=9490 RepID=A0ABQ9ULX1_SAGOE|nr:hypothetical protein P7K49_022718 [Saguinus oedipus]
MPTCPPQLREKSQALETSVVQLAGQVKELSGRLPALSSRLDLQEQMLGLRLSEVRQAVGGRQAGGTSSLPPLRNLSCVDTAPVFPLIHRELWQQPVIRG